MATKPGNPRLWAAIVAMAKAKFHTYPSPAASHWVHENYTLKGGQFIDTSKSKKKRR